MSGSFSQVSTSKPNRDHHFSSSLTTFIINVASANRKDLSVSQKECEEVKVRLRHKEKQAAEVLKTDGAPRVAGLCLNCAQHEAVLAETHTNLHAQAVDRLTKCVMTKTLTIGLASLQFSMQSCFLQGT